MAQEQAGLSLGNRLRTIRLLRGLSLRILASQASLSVNTIRQIERGRTSPTVNSLRRLAQALDVPIEYFFTEGENHSISFVSKDHRLPFKSKDVLLESLAHTLIQQKLYPFMLTLSPGADTSSHPSTHPGEEFIHCLIGELEIAIGTHRYLLKRGDSLLFDSGQPHSFKNFSSESGSAIMIFHAVEDPNIVIRSHLQA